MFILHAADHWPSTLRFSEETSARVVHDGTYSRLFSYRDKAWYEYQGDWIAVDPSTLPEKVLKAVAIYR